MPGLRLTAPQAQCLFGLDSETWDAVLAALLDAKFLSRTHNGLFAMAPIQASDGPDFRNRRRQERDELWMIS
jgi:hypothetical protein